MEQEQPLLVHRPSVANRAARYLPNVQQISRHICCAQSTWSTTTSEIKEQHRSAAAGKLLFLSRLHLELPYLHMTPLSALCTLIVTLAWIWLVVSVIAGTLQVGRVPTRNVQRILLLSDAWNPDPAMLEIQPVKFSFWEAHASTITHTAQITTQTTTRTTTTTTKSTAISTANAAATAAATAARSTVDSRKPQEGELLPLPWPLYYKPDKAAAPSQGNDDSNDKKNGTEFDGGGHSKHEETLWLIFSYEYERRLTLRIIYFTIAFLGAAALMRESYRWSLSALSLVCCSEVQSELKMSVRNAVENDFRDFLIVYKDLFIVSPKLTVIILNATLSILRHNFDTVCNINCDYKVDPDDFKPVEWKNNRALGLFDELHVLINLYFQKQWGAAKFNSWSLFRHAVTMLTRGSRAPSRGALVLFKRSQNLLRAQVKQQQRRVMHRWKKKKFFTNAADISQFSIPDSMLATASTEDIISQVDKGLFLRHIGVREFMEARAKRKRGRRFRILFVWSTGLIVVALWGCFVVSLVLAHLYGSRTDGAGDELLSVQFLPEWGALLAATLGSLWMVLISFEDVRMRLVESLLAANVEAIVEYANIGINMLWSISVEETMANFVLALSEEAQNAENLDALIDEKVKHVEVDNILRTIGPPSAAKPQQKKRGYVVMDDKAQRFEHSMIAASKHSLEYVYLPVDVEDGTAEKLQYFMEKQRAELLVSSLQGDPNLKRPTRSEKREDVVFASEYANDAIGQLGHKLGSMFSRRQQNSEEETPPPSSHRVFEKCKPDTVWRDLDAQSEKGEVNDESEGHEKRKAESLAESSNKSGSLLHWQSRIIDPKDLSPEQCSEAANAIARDSTYFVTSERVSLGQLFEALTQTERPTKWSDVTTPGRE